MILNGRIGRLEMILGLNKSNEAHPAWAEFLAFFDCLNQYGDPCPHVAEGNASPSNHPYTSEHVVRGRDLVRDGKTTVASLLGGGEDADDGIR